MDDAVRQLTAADPAVVVIGASAGAVESLKAILPLFPRSLPAPVLIVVHVPPDRDSALPALLSSHCEMRVVEADDKLTAQPGVVYFAPPDYHLLVDRERTLSLSVDEPVHFSRPSIDVLFESAAYAFGERTVGLLLSGASADGAEGLAQIRRCGGLTWVQQPESATVATMPRAALALYPHPTLEPSEMGALLAAWGSRS
jgi:two-component system chemotaxis response regulator CheB